MLPRNTSELRQLPTYSASRQGLNEARSGVALTCHAGCVEDVVGHEFAPHGHDGHQVRVVGHLVQRLSDSGGHGAGAGEGVARHAVTRNTHT